MSDEEKKKIECAACGAHTEPHDGEIVFCSSCGALLTTDQCVESNGDES